MFAKYLRSSISHSPFSKSLFSSYDVAVIGGGPGGYVAAIKAAQLGLKTACIEKRGTLGGTCLNVGCIPSKALLNISHKYEEAEHQFKGMGINVGNLSFDWSTVQKKKSQSVNALCSGIEGLFKKNKVDYVKGLGTLASANTINVTKNDGGSQTVEAKNIILATGSEPTPFQGIPFDEEYIVSSTGALDFKNVPKSLIVIGGGVIGLEMGSVYKRFGSDVHVVEFLDRITPGLDKEVSTEFMKILKKQGLQFTLSTKVVSGKKVSGGVEIVVEDAKGGNSRVLNAEKVLISTGRRAVTNGLGLEKVGLEIDKTGKIVVNSHFETKTPSIFAIGDIVSGPMLAHKAEEEGIACVEYIASKVKNHSFGGHVNYQAIPNVVYTNPEVASVGKTEEELKAEGIKYKKGKFPFLANSRAKTNDDFPGFIKVLADFDTDRILGVHVIGPNAGELIAEAVLAMEYGASSEDIARTCHAHPTLSEAMKEACLATFDKPIHM